MMLTKKRIIIMAAFIVLGIAAMLIAYTIISDRGKDSPADSNTLKIQYFGKNYESCRQEISALIQSINERYGEEFNRLFLEELTEASESDTLDEPIPIGVFRDIIENYNSTNTSWDDDFKVNDGWSRCRVAPGLVIDVEEPMVISDTEITDSGRIEITINSGDYGPKVPNARIYNKIIYNNAERYLCKFFEGIIEENQLQDALKEAFNTQDARQITLNINGRNYNLQRNINDVRISFDR